MAEELSAQAQELHTLVVELMELVRGGEATPAATGDRAQHKAEAHAASAAPARVPEVAHAPPPVAANGEAKRKTPEKAIPLDDHELKQF